MFMTLEEWLDINDITPMEMCNRLKIAHPQIYRFMKKKRTFGKELGWKIYTFTKRQVSLEHLLYWTT